MFVRQLWVPGILLILTVALNGCAQFSKEVKLEDVDNADKVLQTEEILAIEDLSPAIQETVKAEDMSGDVAEWGLETEEEDDPYFWMSLGSSQCFFY